MLGIIGAMEVEVESLKEMMENQEILKRAGMEFYKGEICGKEVVVVRSGIGKVNAAICTQVLIDVFQVDAVINTGVAGSLNPEIHICDIVVSTEAMEHDMDVSPLGYEKGVIPDMKTSSYPADPNLRILAKSSIKAAGLDVAVFDGKVVSGDQFIATPEKKDMLCKLFGGDCAEMEGGSIAHTAYLNQVPYLVIRAISDQADGKAEMDYPTFEKKAAENSVKLLVEMIRAY
ncbi:MAG: 5'-methylthioadenosine/adenosylhomocysteine nucleosidase [Eubacterium sp.]|nr:5'-methylthioadenosine/adenosylhomocysteine nucleosidase [Eubacterium sp.]